MRKKSITNISSLSTVLCVASLENGRNKKLIHTIFNHITNLFICWDSKYCNFRKWLLSYNSRNKLKRQKYLTIPRELGNKALREKFWRRLDISPSDVWNQNADCPSSLSSPDLRNMAALLSLSYKTFHNVFLKSGRFPNSETYGGSLSSSIYLFMLWQCIMYLLYQLRVQ